MCWREVILGLRILLFSIISHVEHKEVICTNVSMLLKQLYVTVYYFKTGFITNIYLDSLGVHNFKHTYVLKIVYFTHF